MSPAVSSPVFGQTPRSSAATAASEAASCAQEKGRAPGAGQFRVVANGESPAKGLLNFKASYGREEAYNALADLRSLEPLMHIFAIWPNQRVTLCTADKDLTLCWSGIRTSNFVRRTGNISFDIDAAAPFPGVTEEKWKGWLAE